MAQQTYSRRFFEIGVERMTAVLADPNTPADLRPEYQAKLEHYSFELENYDKPRRRARGNGVVHMPAADTNEPLDYVRAFVEKFGAWVYVHEYRDNFDFRISPGHPADVREFDKRLRFRLDASNNAVLVYFPTRRARAFAYSLLKARES